MIIATARIQNPVLPDACTLLQILKKQHTLYTNRRFDWCKMVRVTMEISGKSLHLNRGTWLFLWPLLQFPSSYNLPKDLSLLQKYLSLNDKAPASADFWICYLCCCLQTASTLTAGQRAQHLEQELASRYALTNNDSGAKKGEHAQFCAFIYMTAMLSKTLHRDPKPSALKRFQSQS